jgi:four helix bundle protein
MTRAVKQQNGNMILLNQCVRSGTSVGANYREANDALGKKDFIHRLKIARKEAKETTYWLQLIAEEHNQIAPRIHSLTQESVGLTKILSSIITKSEQKNRRY